MTRKEIIWHKDLRVHVCASPTALMVEDICSFFRCNKSDAATKWLNKFNIVDNVLYILYIGEDVEQYLRVTDTELVFGCKLSDPSADAAIDCAAEIEQLKSVGIGPGDIEYEGAIIRKVPGVGWRYISRNFTGLATSANEAKWYIRKKRMEIINNMETKKTWEVQHIPKSGYCYTKPRVSHRYISQVHKHLYLYEGCSSISHFRFFLDEPGVYTVLFNGYEYKVKARNVKALLFTLDEMLRYHDMADKYGGKRYDIHEHVWCFYYW